MDTYRGAHAMSFFRAKNKSKDPVVAKTPEEEPAPKSGLLRNLSRKKTGDVKSSDSLIKRSSSAKSGSGPSRGLSRSGSKNLERTLTPDRVEKTNSEWKKTLKPQEYNVLRKKIMEKPYEGDFVYYQVPKNMEAIFFCKGCDTPVFTGRALRTTAEGWATFERSIPGTVEQSLEDFKNGSRLELLCKGCDGFLGIVNQFLEVNSAVLQVRELSKEEYKLILG
ncbi:Peptide methionine sulfoxide reductase B5 [Porphyridium purpureum]|uniref:peptide-methionine (R)-S-oxide reductase n=1 Tax=Porphyridium purpureum TaxID=35688 RepID=A0A5J4Z157_PORPP|nr:Peptide methionine sulfoxide reductase B5 [Porphyridium purpureum]|eukprot:POR4866..scf208_2